jgi:hypothetical protein
MSGSKIIKRAWFEEWREPSLFFRAAVASKAVVGLPHIFMNRKWNYLLEAWAAGKFATLLAEHNKLEVCLGKNETDPDFYVSTKDTIMPFELTEVTEADRERGKEYHRASKHLDVSQLALFDPDLRFREFCHGLVEALAKKSAKNYNPKRHLLLYNNIVFSDLLRAKLHSIHQSTSVFKNEFESLWIMSGDYTVRVWPPTKHGGLLSAGKS